MTMGEKWRVTVERLDSDGEWEAETFLEAPREVLARFAPGVVADALGVSTANIVHAAVAIDAGSGEQVASAGPVFQDERPADVPKRKRRTKAEMEADRLREQQETLAAAERLSQFPASVPTYQQDAAEVAVTNAGPDAYPAPAPEPEVPFNPFAPK